MTLLAEPPPTREPDAPGDRRSQHPVAVLSRRMDGECRGAADPFEIAAHLEASGFNDASVRRRYDVPDVFALAEVLFDLVPRSSAIAPGPVGTSIRERIRLLLRGLLYILPGVLTLLLLPSIPTGGADTLVLVLSLMIGWSSGQAISFLAYQKINDGELALARAVLRQLALVALALSAIGAVLLVIQDSVSPVVATLAFFQIVYFLGATVLLTLERELRLLIALVPLTTAAISAAAGAPTIILGLAPVSMLLLVVFAGEATSAGLSHFVARVVSARDLLTSLPYFIHGLTYACLVAVAIVQWANYSSGRVGVRVDLLMVPLILSTAAGEWQLANFRKRAALCLHDTGSTADFRSRVSRNLRRSIGAYALVIAAMSIAIAGYTAIEDSLTQLDLVRLLSYGLLGAAFFVGLLLVAHGYAMEVISVTTPCCLILGSLTASRAGEGSMSPFVAFGLTAAAMFCLLLYFAVARLENVSCHR